MNYFTTISTPLGKAYLASDGGDLTGLWFENQKYFPPFIPNISKPNDTIAKNQNDIAFVDANGDLCIFREATEWLDIYFKGDNPEFFPKIKPEGTEFRHKVWDILLNIPFGQVITYGDIAKELKMDCAQAVGGAVGHNPISVIIPCHRVLGAKGKLTGYAGGLDKKIWLLKNEGYQLNEN